MAAKKPPTNSALKHIQKCVQCMFPTIAPANAIAGLKKPVCRVSSPPSHNKNTLKKRIKLRDAGMREKVFVGNKNFFKCPPKKQREGLGLQNR
jgi:hypothetical protein